MLLMWYNVRVSFRNLTTSWTVLSEWTGSRSPRLCIHYTTLKVVRDWPAETKIDNNSEPEQQAPSGCNISDGEGSEIVHGPQQGQHVDTMVI